jgi:hypothetical protein
MKLYLSMKLEEIEKNQNGWEKRCGGRLPLSFFDHVKRLNFGRTVSGVIGIVGSQRLIERIIFRRSIQIIFSCSYVGMVIYQ